MAPEVMRDHGGAAVASFASDMYSLGVLILSIFFPQLPYLVGEKIVFPPNADGNLVSLIQALTQVDSEKRPAASDALLHPFFVGHLASMVQSGRLAVVDEDAALKTARETIKSLRPNAVVEFRVNRDQIVADVTRNMLAAPSSVFGLRVAYAGEVGVDQGMLALSPCVCLHVHDRVPLQEVLLGIYSLNS